MTITSNRSASSRWRKAGKVAIPAAFSLVVLAGCAPAAETPSSDGTTTVTAWVSRSWSNSADNFASFMEENPDIIVETEVIDTDDILQRLLRAADAGQPLPDIIHDDIFVLEAFNDAGFVLPINEYVEQFEAEDPEAFEQVLPIVFSEPTIDGQILGVSNAANMDVLYYNVPWFEEAGVTLPFETYEDMYDAGLALLETRPDGIPLSIQAIAGDGVTGLKTVLIGAGAPFDGATPDLQSDGGLYTIELFQRMQQAGMLPPEAIAWGEAEARGAFVSGAGMIIDGFTTAGDFNAVGDFDFGTDWAQTLLPIESGSGVEGARPTSSRMWSVTTASENPEAAWRVLQHTTTPEFLVPQVLQGGVPPRNSEAIVDQAVLDFWPFFSEEVREGYLNSVSAPSALNSGEIEGVLEQLWGEIVTGVGGSAQELADKYQPQLDALN